MGSRVQAATTASERRPRTARPTELTWARRVGITDAALATDDDDDVIPSPSLLTYQLFCLASAVYPASNLYLCC